MSDFIELTIAVTDVELANIVMAQLTFIGAEGFQEEKGVVKAFMPAGVYDEQVSDEIIKQNGLTYSKSVIKKTNWNAEWEAGFTPVTIGSYCRIRASFHEKDDMVKHDIIITPKMSFGTGHHATTCLMVAAIELQNLAGKLVFDFGTGTGILAILAQLSGAAKVTAIDNDDWSISNAAENFTINGCAGIALRKADEILGNDRYDVILANINRNVILDQLHSIKQHLAENGVVVLSGLLTGDEEIITGRALQHDLRLQRKTEMNGWICLLLATG